MNGRHRRKGEIIKLPLSPTSGIVGKGLVVLRLVKIFLISVKVSEIKGCTIARKTSAHINDNKCFGCYIAAVPCNASTARRIIKVTKIANK